MIVHRRRHDEGVGGWRGGHPPAREGSCDDGYASCVPRLTRAARPARRGEDGEHGECEGRRQRVAEPAAADVDEADRRSFARGRRPLSAAAATEAGVSRKAIRLVRCWRRPQSIRH